MHPVCCLLFCLTTGASDVDDDGNGVDDDDNAESLAGMRIGMVDE